MTAIALCVAANARTAGASEHDLPDRSGQALPSPIEWGVRLNAGVGVGGAGAMTGGPAARVGLDGEYWLSRHWAVGAQIGWQNMASFTPWGPGNGQATGTADVYSIAPSVTLRGRNPRNFPIVSLAAGVAIVNAQIGVYCDPAYFGTPAAGCDPNGGYSGVAPAVHGSLTAGWLFHPWGVGMGPMFRFEAFAGQTNGVSVSTGMQIGFGYAPHG
ncbi:MAG TPA: hypothetical protein VGY54_08805 [Polyangiaceae bacterium]|jgi:hypothetical protein|nr:hypothetical protein [Polyangiaceae bacterium]